MKTPHRTLIAILLAGSLGLAGLIGFVRLNETAKLTTTVTFKWSQNLHAPSYEEEWELVGSDQYIYATIMTSEFDSGWMVFHNGASFGEFATKGAAMVEAAAVARRLGRKTR